MNNEPVAWMQIHHKDGTPTKFSNIKTWEDDIPLYTNPAKTLTDEEIKELWNPLPDTKTYDSDILKFARAILRKAQEK
jgi:hypothetical protein